MDFIWLLLVLGAAAIFYYFVSYSKPQDDDWYKLPTLENQGDRMSVYIFTTLLKPALNTASSIDVFIMQRFCLPTMLSLVGSSRSMFKLI